MESVDAVARLEIAGSNIDRAIGDDRLRAEDRTEWFTIGIGEGAEEGALRGFEHHQLAIIGDIVDDVVGDSRGRFGFTWRLASPEKSTSDRIECPQAEVGVFSINEDSALGNGRGGYVNSGAPIPPNQMTIGRAQGVNGQPTNVHDAIGNRRR